MHIIPKILNVKLSSIIVISFKFNNNFKLIANPIVFIAAEMVLANANKIPIDAPSSGPIDLEIIK